jgi:hypothetical protein
MPVIFISYRRDDSAGHSGRLFDRLREHFGKDHVFLDVVGIDAGVDFVDTLDKALGSCDVLLAVIGREWLTCCDKQGRRRLDDTNDFIRAEISTALKRNVRVVPVLVEGAEMPPTDALPEELKRLTRRQAVELRDSRWDADIAALISALERDAATGAPPAPVRPAATEAVHKPRRQALLWGIGLALVAALIAGGLYFSFSGGPQDKPDTPDPGLVSSLPEPVVPSPEEVTASPEEATSAPEPVVPSPETTQPQEPETEEPKTVRTPNLVGLPLEQAIQKLRTSGLTAGEQQAKQTADVPARQVLSQFPRAGKEIDVDSSVDLVYAEPPPDTRIGVPDLVGMDLQRAMDVLRGAGFELRRQSEQSVETKYKVLRQEPAARSRVDKGTEVLLVYAIPVTEMPPDRVGRTTTVFIHYADAADRTAADGLEAYLRGLTGLRGASYKSLLSKRGQEPGKLFYSSESQADLAKSIAGRSGYWLSQTYDRKVVIEAKLDPRVARTGMVLTIPGSR